MMAAEVLGQQEIAAGLEEGAPAAIKIWAGLGNHGYVLECHEKDACAV